MIGRKNTPRPRRPKATTSKQPLTYYRSQTAEASSSPFEKRAQKPKRLRKATIITIDVLAVTLLLSGLVYSLMLSPDPKIVVSGRAYHDSGVYRSLAAAKLASLQNRTKFTLDETKVADALQNNFPEIASANIELPVFSPRPTIRLDISPPVFYLSSSGQTYVVDEQGTAVAKKEDLPRITGLPLVIDQSGFNAAAGKQVLNARGADFIKHLVKQCRQSKIPLQSLTLPAIAQELDLRTTDHSYYVKFFLGGDTAPQIGQFLAARHQFDSTSTQPAEYLDVRVPGKVFYK